ncbi:MAG: hypothetical protein QMD23_06785 [Candidatus Bathyarchaeia archaeon]|nr:hypothetical protein [Candidatus Bathyarchaeia archaeon]
MANRVFDCFPKESWFKITGVTDKAIRYLSEEVEHLYLAEWRAVKPKIGEESIAEFDIKLTISEKEGLSILVVQKDPKTGVYKTKRIMTSIKNVVATTTDINVSQELKNRLWEMTTSAELTPQVIRFKIDQAKKPVNERVDCSKARKIVRYMVKTIKKETPKNFIIPYADQLLAILEPLENISRTTRDIDKLLEAICAVAYLHYRNRPIHIFGDQPHIICLPEDLYYAIKYMGEFIIGTFTGESKRREAIVKAILMLNEANRKINSANLAAVANISGRHARRWLDDLCDANFLRIKRRDKTGITYELTGAKPNITTIELDLGKLTELTKEYLDKHNVIWELTQTFPEPVLRIDIPKPRKLDIEDLEPVELSRETNEKQVDSS